MKTGTEMQTMAKFKSPQKPLLWNCLVCVNHKHWVGLHITLSPLTSSSLLTIHIEEMTDTDRQCSISFFPTHNSNLSCHLNQEEFFF